MEHRCGERVTLRAPVRLRRAGWDASGMLTNASLSGGFVRTRLQAPILSLVEIEVFGSRVSAYVVRVNSRGIALEWFEFAPVGVARLLTPLTPVQTTQPHARLCATARSMGAAASVKKETNKPTQRHVGSGVRAKFDRDRTGEQIEGLAKDVREITTVSVGH